MRRFARDFLNARQNDSNNPFRFIRLIQAEFVFHGIPSFGEKETKNSTIPLYAIRRIKFLTRFGDAVGITTFTKGVDFSDWHVRSESIISMEMDG